MPAPYSNGVTMGRIVRYVFRDGTERPAIIVRVADEENQIVNLQVFLDGQADTALLKADETPADGLAYRGNVAYSRPDPEGNGKPYSWHWPND